MINLKKLEGTDIFEFTIEGDIDKTSVEDFYNLLQVKSEQNEKVKLLGTVHKFPGFEDFKSFSSTLNMKAKAVRNLSKYAILSDRDWVETIMPVGDFITPGIPLKQFDLDERDEAIEWLKKEEDTTVSQEEYLSNMDVGRIENTQIYHFTVDGKIDEAGITAIYNILKDNDRQGKINLLGYFRDFDGFENVKSFMKGLKVDLAVFGNLDKFAIITDKKWVSTVAEIESKIIPGITMKGFRENEEDQAIDWLKTREG